MGVQGPRRLGGKIVEAIESDKERLEPSGKSRWARFAAKAPDAVMDAITTRGFER